MKVETNLTITKNQLKDVQEIMNSFLNDKSYILTRSMKIHAEMFLAEIKNEIAYIDQVLGDKND